jgi:DNA modification methylase
MTQETYNDDCVNVLPTIQDCSVDGIMTDPPFNINLVPQRKTHDIIANDNIAPEEFKQWLSSVIHHCYRVLKHNKVAWFCCNWQCSHVFHEVLTDVGFEIVNQVVWAKTNFGIGYQFRPQHEYIWVVSKGEPNLLLEAAPSNVWNIARHINTLHPTEKPIELVRKALSQYNKEGDVILDPFAGSFSTCMGAKSLGMGYIGVEIDPIHYETGTQRLDGCGIIEKTNKKGKLVTRVEGAPLMDWVDANE